MIEKNGFPKPLGLFLIIIILSLTCFVNLVFADGFTSSDQDYLTDEKMENASESGTFDGMPALPNRIGF